MEINPVFETAVEFVNNTSRSLFLTGKAGTGKTTFLKYIRENCKKRSVVVAPTGVAAINAGGVTMHSFFQLPLGPFLPVSGKSNQGVTDKHTLFRNLRISEQKRQIMRDLELLIIDEVSMVRCDALDAIDVILRYYRKKPHQPFGDVQVLFIGDLFQLPPVMPENEWNILRDYYASEFFFHSKVIEQFPLLYIELKKIYRQNEETFIRILNHVRNNELTSIDIEILNSRLNVSPKTDVKYVTLTSHNFKADRINQDELKKLSGKVFSFKGIIDGDFQEKALPTEEKLELKEGAQVMFIRNDTSDDRNYYNGKLAVIETISEDGISVRDNDNKVFKVGKETWNNIRYSYDPATREITEEKLGSFSQYPLRLAWAITIHKSQGLTFEHAILDTAESFAPGQVYVALSRCVSLDGIILRSPVVSSSVKVHQQVLEFANQETESQRLQQLLTEEKSIFQNQQLLKTFQFEKLIESVENFLEYAEEKMPITMREVVGDTRLVLIAVKEQEDVAGRFRNVLTSLLREGDEEKLTERIKSSIEYFSKIFIEKIITPLSNLITTLQKQKRTKKYLKRLIDLRSEALVKINEIRSVSYNGNILFEGQPLIIEETSIKKRSGKIEKGSSLAETLNYWREGLNAEEIAAKRNLALSTIETHLALLVGNGSIDINAFVPGHLEIREAIGASDSKLTDIYNKLDGKFSFNQIRAVIAAMKREGSQ